MNDIENHTIKSELILKSAKRTFTCEAQAIKRLSTQVGNSFVEAIKVIASCKSHVAVSGIGKSGIIGKKIVATLSSTGTPSFFLHPTEAIHGDLGMLTKNDILLAISSSGKTEELIRLIPIVKRLGITLIAMAGDPESPLAQEADYFLDISVENEACPLQLAPTASTTATLAMGDAIAIALMEIKEFTPVDFAFRHPGGSLGRKLLTHVSDVMSTTNLPVVERNTDIKDVISTISTGMKGMVVIVEDDIISGAITDGDICRAFEKYNGNFMELKAEDIMSDNPKIINQDELIVDAENMMHDNGIVSLIVEKEEGKRNLTGIIQRYNV